MLTNDFSLQNVCTIVVRNVTFLLPLHVLGLGDSDWLQVPATLPALVSLNHAVPFAIDPARRPMETGVGAVNVELLSSSGFLHAIIPSEHGPPSALLPRHVLISVFRI